ncbi:hypothetical protein ACIA8O_25580 [Kitasatospora sp. NPDC051853]|uniref:hypothetical protein n=1 Tax=Kitasatospora sp. NPDC051853 TaxID=3364058 RepID=UPI0037ACBDC5
MAKRRAPEEIWAGLNARQRAFLLAVVDAGRSAPGEEWVVFSLDPAPQPGGADGGGVPATVLDGLRADGWTARGSRATLRALFERDLVGLWAGLVRLPDGTLAHRLRTRALDLGIAVAREWSPDVR